MKKKSLVLLLMLLCSLICILTLVGCDTSTTTPPPDGGGQGTDINPSLPSSNEQEENTKPTQPEKPSTPSDEKKIPVCVYIDGRVSDTIYANASTGKITPPTKPQDITTNPNSEKYFYGWFTDANFQTPYTDDITFDGSQSLYGKWITVYTSYFTYTVDKGVATITGYYQSNDTVLVIPAYINSFPVKSISSDAFANKTQIRTAIICNGIETISGFKGCNSMTSVVLPESVTSIGDSAFYNCSSLTSIYFPSGVANIGNSAFYGCESLTSIEIPNKVTNIGYSAFYGCDGLTSIEMPNSVTSIGWTVFGGCYNLSYVILSSNIIRLPSYAFSGCSSLTSVEIPSGVTRIDNSVFEGCSKLESVRFEDNSQLTYIDNQAFLGCRSLINIEIPNSVTSIGERVFENCIELTSVTFEDNSQLTCIGQSAFFGCSNLINIDLPNSVTTIGSLAFSNCNLLESMVIPCSVTSIGSNAFKDCISLNGVYITSISSWCEINFNGDNANPLAYAHNLYLNNEPITELIIPQEVTSISSIAFSYCDSLTNIEISSSVTSIGSKAFSNCNNLASITFGDESQLTSIGNSAFAGCSSLECMTLPFVGGNVNATSASSSTLFGYIFGSSSYDGGMETKQYYANNNYSTYYIPSGLKSVIILGGNVLYGAFYGCSNLTSVEILSDATNMGYATFSGCSNLESMTLPFVGGYANATSASSNTLFGYIFGSSSYDGGIETKQHYTSYSAATPSYPYYSTYYIPSSLKSVTILGGNVLYGAFDGCGNLTSIVIPSSITSIGNYAFRGCGSLTSIEIPSGVTNMGASVFSGCSNLRHNKYDNGLYVGDKENPYLVLIKAKDTLITSCKTNDKTKFIHSYAFAECSNLAMIEIPGDLISIDSNAFDGCVNITTATMPTIIISSIPKKDKLNIVVINGGTSIGASAFRGCSSLASISIPSSVTSIGELAFAQCSSLTSIEIPSSVTSIGAQAFGGCSSMTSVTFGDDSQLTCIGEYAFSGCSNLVSIDIPSGVTSIGGRAFQSCSSMTSIFIPSTVISITGILFFNCNSSSLDVYCEASSKPSGWYDYWDAVELGFTPKRVGTVWNYKINKTE